MISQLLARLTLFVNERALAWVFESSTGVWMPSGNLRVPDISFVPRARLPRGLEPGFLRVVPALVVEVLSPGDSERAILDKVGEYLSAGARLVWVVDPLARRAAVHRSLTEVRDLDDTEDLDGLDVAPGFRCRLGDILG